MNAGILTVMGQPDWVADTEEKYIKIAMDLAADMPRLRVLRDRLRCADVGRSLSLRCFGMP